MEATPILLYRADSGHSIGLGHIVRAKNICGELSKKGIIPIIITCSPQNIVKNLHSLGFKVITLSENTGHLNAIIETLRKTNATILINDILDTDEEYSRQLKTQGIQLIHFDDLGQGRCYADILIDANLPPTKQALEETQLQLFGKDFMAIDSRLAPFHDCEKTIPKTARKITVSFGGSDPRGLSQWILDNNSELFAPFDITVVVGNACKNTAEIAETCNRYGYTFIHNTDAMPELLFSSDLAIISGGITLYEAACAGTPSLVIPQVEHQYTIAKHFEHLGITLCPFAHDELKPRLFELAFRHLAYDKISRSHMSKRGKKEIDGKGIFRICSAIETFITKRDIHYVQI